MPTAQQAAQLFLSTPSARRATVHVVSVLSSLAYFYPRPPRGGRHRRAIYVHLLRDFYPRPPRGGRPSWVRMASCRAGIFLSTPSARRATQVHQRGPIPVRISIHALREEGDTGTPTSPAAPMHFYPRPPRGGRPGTLTSPAAPMHFYPRPPRGGRLSRVRLSGCGAGISIHALREEGDRLACCGCIVARLFLSTPSARRATGHLTERNPQKRNFYPRPPRGGRRVAQLSM